MELYKGFCDNLSAHVKQFIDKSFRSDAECRKTWGYDGAQIVRRNGCTNMFTYFRYCLTIGCNPVFLMIYLMRSFNTRQELIDYVNQVYDSYENEKN